MRPRNHHVMTQAGKSRLLTLALVLAGLIWGRCSRSAGSAPVDKATALKDMAADSAHAPRTNGGGTFPRATESAVTVPPQ